MGKLEEETSKIMNNNTFTNEETVSYVEAIINRGTPSKKKGYFIVTSILKASGIQSKNTNKFKYINEESRKRYLDGFKKLTALNNEDMNFQIKEVKKWKKN